jgi:UDPglucose 6-dehydrogenase
MREAPSLALITALQDLGATVRVYDPAGMDQARQVLEAVTYCEGAYECAEGVDALVIATEWEQFRALDLVRLREAMAAPIIVDLRNIYRPDEMERLGFMYESIGRPARRRTGPRVERTSVTESSLASPQPSRRLTADASDPIEA